MTFRRAVILLIRTDLTFVRNYRKPQLANGSWSMTLHGTSAKGSFDILVNDIPHVAYTFPGMKQAPIGPGYAFSVYGPTQAGLLTVTLKNDGNMTYVIAPYNYDGLEYASVTFPGHT